MSSENLKRTYSELPPAYMAEFAGSIDKCIVEWGFIYGDEQPKFITMLFLTVMEEALLSLNQKRVMTKPIFSAGFNDVIKKHNLFEISPFTPEINEAALIALQSAWELDNNKFVMFTDFWETLLMDIISSVTYVSTNKRRYGGSEE